jgi:hypothetical protein
VAHIIKSRRRRAACRRSGRRKDEIIWHPTGGLPDVCRDCPRRAELTSTAMPSFITVTEPSGDTCWMEMLPAAVNVVDVIESPCLGNGYTATQ